MKEKNLAFLPAVFSTTLLVSAGLLFVIQPMITKMILPMLGGTPAVWNTCIMFFQLMLLTGYAYAHAISRLNGFRRQIIIHSAVLIIAGLMLPINISDRWLSLDGPIAKVLAILAASVSLPFFVLSSSAPLLQRWFANTCHPAAKDPYFLYSASNLGSILALLSYPALIEPFASLVQQRHFWSSGYGVFAVLTTGCAFLAWRSTEAAFSRQAGMTATHESKSESPACTICPGLAERLSWLILSFVPSSLMLGVTTFFTTDIAAIPLFWVVPLALYLLSFTIVFAKTSSTLHSVITRLLPVAVLTILFLKFSNIKVPLWTACFIHLSAFFIIAMVFHGELAMRRPQTQQLTGFYLLMSAGGLLGGVFNALAAPVVFTTIAEYPIVLVFAFLILPFIRREEHTSQKTRQQVYIDAAMSLVLWGMVSWLILKWPAGELDLTSIDSGLGMKENLLVKSVIYGLPVLLCYAFLFMNRSLRFGFVAGAVVACMAFGELGENIVFRDRSFFGVLTVSNDPGGKYRSFIHGTTMHGKQNMDRELSQEPLTYFHRQGPIGQVFEEFSGPKAKSRVAIVGLGVGTLAAYGQQRQQFDFYEIDPAVKNIAANPAYFTFLKNCRAEYKIILGDGRLKIKDAPDNGYNLIVLDAFSSDAIPVHLLTREAFKLYLSKLEASGILAIQITNRYVSLEPVIASLAADSGLVGLFQEDGPDPRIGKFGSKWIVLARETSHLGNLSNDKRWIKLKATKSVKVWTDDFSNILSVFRWK